MKYFKYFWHPVCCKCSKAGGLTFYVFQHWGELSSSICNSFLNNLSMRASTTAAVCSSLGMIIGFKGATRAFPLIKTLLCIGVAQQQIGNFSITNLTWFCKMVQLSSSSRWSSCSPFVHSVTVGAGIMSSHPRPFLHTSCKISSTYSTTSTSTPSGS